MTIFEFQCLNLNDPIVMSPGTDPFDFKDPVAAWLLAWWRQPLINASSPSRNTGLRYVRPDPKYNRHSLFEVYNLSSAAMQPVIKMDIWFCFVWFWVNGQCNFRYYSFLFWTCYSYSVLLPTRQCHYYSYSISVLKKIVVPIPVFVNEFILNYRFYSIIVNENITQRIW